MPPDGRYVTVGPAFMTSEEIIAEREPTAIPSLTKRARMVATDPLLSVVMPVFNERQTIDEIIRRVLPSPSALS